ncbi:MAG: hypothetical protein ACE5QF_05885 [Thermoplasmata archaeon]
MRIGPYDSVEKPRVSTRSILLLVSEYDIYQDFANWVVSSMKSEGESMLHVMLNGEISFATEESHRIPEVLCIAHIRECENEVEMAKRTLDALSRMDRFEKIFFDPLSSFSQLYSEDSAPVHILKELIPFLEHRRTLGYFCLAMNKHHDDTIAQCKDAVDVCIQVERQEGSMLVQAINARGIYRRDFFLPRVFRNWYAIEEPTQFRSQFDPVIKSVVGID